MPTKQDRARGPNQNRKGKGRLSQEMAKLESGTAGIGVLRTWRRLRSGTRKAGVTRKRY